jgi:hypothetical protein
LSALDWPGAVLSVLVVGAPFLLIERLSWDLRDPLGLVFVLGTLILLALFIVVERRVAWSLLDLRLFRSRTYTCGAVSAASYFLPATFAYLLLPLYAQVVLRLTPFFAGLVLRAVRSSRLVSARPRRRRLLSQPYPTRLRLATLKSAKLLGSGVTPIAVGVRR